MRAFDRFAGGRKNSDWDNVSTEAQGMLAFVAMGWLHGFMDSGVLLLTETLRATPMVTHVRPRLGTIVSPAIAFLGNCRGHAAVK